MAAKSPSDLAFGSKVLAYDPFLTEARARTLGVQLMAELDNVYRDADFITVHMPVTEQDSGHADTFGIRQNETQGGDRELRARRNHCRKRSADGIGFRQSGRSRAGRIFSGAITGRAPFSETSEHHFDAALGGEHAEAQEKCGIEVAEVIAGYLVTGEVRNAVNLPYLDSKTYEQVKPYLTLGEKLGKLLARYQPAHADRLHITYGGKAQELQNIDPITRAILLGFLSRASVKDLNNVNVRSIASTLGLTVEEKRSSEPVTFNEWLHVQVFRGDEKISSAGGTFFGSPDNPRIVRVFSQPTGICTFRSGAFASESGPSWHRGLPRHAHEPPQGQHRQHELEPGYRRRTGPDGSSIWIAYFPGMLEEIQRDPDISNVHVVKL